MKFEVAVDHLFRTVCSECVAHHIETYFQRANVTCSLCGKPRRQTFENSTDFEYLQNIFLAEVDDAGASSRRLRHEPVLREQVDCLPDRSLGNAEFARPCSFDDPNAGTQRATGDLVPEAICDGVFHEGFGGTI